MNRTLCCFFFWLVLLAGPSSCSSEKQPDQVPEKPKVKFVTANVSLNPPANYFLSWNTSSDEPQSVKIYGLNDQGPLNYNKVEPLEETTNTTYSIENITFSHFHLLISGQDTLIIPIPNKR